LSKKGPGQFSTLRAVLYGLKQGCSLCFAKSDTWPQQQPSLWRTRRRRRSTEHGEGRRRRGRPPGGGAGHRARGTAACPVAPRVRARDRLRPPAPPRPFVLDGPPELPRLPPAAGLPPPAPAAPASRGCWASAVAGAAPSSRGLLVPCARSAAGRTAAPWPPLVFVCCVDVLYVLDVLFLGVLGVLFVGCVCVFVCASICVSMV